MKPSGHSHKAAGSPEGKKRVLPHHHNALLGFFVIFLKLDTFQR